MTPTLFVLGPLAVVLWADTPAPAPTVVHRTQVRPDFRTPPPPPAGERIVLTDKLPVAPARR